MTALPLTHFTVVAALAILLLLLGLVAFVTSRVSPRLTILAMFTVGAAWILCFSIWVNFAFKNEPQSSSKYGSVHYVIFIRAKDWPSSVSQIDPQTDGVANATLEGQQGVALTKAAVDMEIDKVDDDRAGLERQLKIADSSQERNSITAEIAGCIEAASVLHGAPIQSPAVGAP